jgi:hypothetical protein
MTKLVKFRRDNLIMSLDLFVSRGNFNVSTDTRSCPKLGAQLLQEAAQENNSQVIEIGDVINETNLAELPLFMMALKNTWGWIR